VLHLSQLSQSENFANAVTHSGEITLPVYDELNPRKIILYKGEQTQAKYIKIKYGEGKSGESEPVVFDSIQILQ